MGTKTMAEAFRVLGFRVLDYEDTTLDANAIFDVFDPFKTPEEKRELIRSNLQDFDVCMDMPHYWIWKEILDVFPDAKVIFWGRDVDAWWKSLVNQFHMNFEHANGNMPDWLNHMFAKMMVPKLFGEFRRQKAALRNMFGTELKYEINWRGQWHPLDEMMSKRLYRQHCADVLTNCPKDKLLVLDSPNCGWEILCDFIGVDAPVEKAWPHVNKNGTIIEELIDEDARIPKALQAEMMSRMKTAGTMLAVGGGIAGIVV